MQCGISHILSLTVMNVYTCDVLVHHEMSYTIVTMLTGLKRTKQLSTVAHDGQTLLCDLSFHPVKLRNAD